MKISQVLKQTEVQQIRGSLIDFDYENNMIGKCAMGVLACEDGNSKHKLSYTNHSGSITYAILNEYNIPKKDQFDLPLIRIGYGQGNIPEKDRDIMIDFDLSSSLTGQIMTLNDSIGLDFDEIAEFLEVTYGL